MSPARVCSAASGHRPISKGAFRAFRETHLIVAVISKAGMANATMPPAKRLESAHSARSAAASPMHEWCTERIGNRVAEQALEQHGERRVAG